MILTLEVGIRIQVITHHSKHFEVLNEFEKVCNEELEPSEARGKNHFTYRLADPHA